MTQAPSVQSSIRTLLRELDSGARTAAMILMAGVIAVTVLISIVFWRQRPPLPGHRLFGRDAGNYSLPGSGSDLPR